MSPANVRQRYDIVIAGARCAGSATALLLARRGFRVLVVDPLPRGRDTLSTHALMRAGVVQLHRWGLLDALRAAGTPAVRTTTFDYGAETISIPIKPKDGIDALYAPRRTVLDPILADAAAAAGADVVHGLSVVDLIRNSTGRVTGARVAGADGIPRTISAGLVIGADGVRSRVARLAEAPVLRAGRHAAACIFGYWNGLDRTDYLWGFRPGLGTGVIPTNDGDACVFVSFAADRFAAGRGDGLEAAFHRALRTGDPELADMLQRVRPSRPLRAFAGTPGFLRRPVGPGWALVGDAGYFRDPITAHGISDALRDAELLARAIFRGHDAALEDYWHARDAVAADLMDISDRVAAYTWSIDEVKVLHHDLSRAMNAGLDVVRSFDGPADTATVVAA